MSFWDEEDVADADADADADDADDADEVEDGEDGDDVGRAPICPSCGVTALPAELSNVIDAGFVCENPDCEAFGDPIDS